MQALDWLTLAGLCFLGASSPGPSLVVVLGEVLRGGRSHGLAAALAHGVAVAMYALVVALGLAVVMARAPALFDVARWLGAGFLLLLAYRSLVHPVRFDGEVEAAAPHSVALAASRGFLVAVLNPKPGLFFIAVYAQFISAQTTIAEKFGMAAVSGVVDASWYLLVALLTSHPAVMGRLQQRAVYLQRAFGILLVALAIRVVWESPLNMLDGLI